MANDKIYFINLPLSPPPLNKHASEYVKNILKELNKKTKNYDNAYDKNINYIYRLIYDIYLNKPLNTPKSNISQRATQSLNDNNRIHQDINYNYNDNTYNKYKISSEFDDLDAAINQLISQRSIVSYINHEYASMRSDDEYMYTIMIFDKLEIFFKLMLNDTIVFENDTDTINTLSAINRYIYKVFIVILNRYKYSMNKTKTIDDYMNKPPRKINIKIKALLNYLKSLKHYNLTYFIRNYAFKKYILNIKDYIYISHYQYLILNDNEYYELLVNIDKYIKTYSDTSNEQQTNDHKLADIKIIFNINNAKRNYNKYKQQINSEESIYKNFIHNLKIDINNIINTTMVTGQNKDLLTTKIYAITIGNMKVN